MFLLLMSTIFIKVFSWVECSCVASIFLIYLLISKKYITVCVLIATSLPILILGFLSSDVWYINETQGIMWGRVNIVNYHTTEMMTPQTLVYYMARKMFTYADWHILYYMFLCATVAYWEDVIKTKLKYILYIIGLVLILTFYTFARPLMFQWLIDGTLSQRTMMPLSVVVMFYIALLVGNKIKIRGDM